MADAPISRTVLDAARLRDAGTGASLEAPLRAVPGLQLDDRHNQALGERLSIRGFGARSSFGIRGVRVLVDGVPATLPDGQTTLSHVDPAYVRSVEVVRGAAAAFLGNAAGGALLLRTGTTRGVGAEASAGEAGLRRFSGSLGTAGYSVYGAWQEQEGFRAHSDWSRLIGGATAVLPAGGGRLELAAHGVDYEARNPGALTFEQFATDPTQASANNLRQRTGERGTQGQLGAGWILPLSRYRLELRAHGGLRTLDNPIPPVIIELDRRFTGVRAQLARDGSGFAAAAGLELEWQHDERVNYANEEGRRGALVLEQTEQVRGLGVFAHAQWQAGERLRLFGAVRGDRYRFSADDHLFSDGDRSGARTLGALSGTVGAAYRLPGGVELFANGASAFETPTTTELVNAPDGAAGFNPELEPERTRSLEAGVRGGGARWHAEFVAFRALVRDKLLPYEDEAAPGRQFFRNAGRARHQGLEAAATVDPAHWFGVHAAYTRLDARFVDHAVGNADVAGRRIPGAAAHQLAVTARAQFADMRMRLDLQRTGRVAVDDANSALAAAYTLLSARISRGDLRAGRVVAEVYLGLENLFDETYAAAVSVNAFGGRYLEPGPGRSLYGGVRLARR